MNTKLSDDIRESLMRLLMCARKECEICKYKNLPKVELPSEECKKRSLDNAEKLAKALCSEHALTQ